MIELKGLFIKMDCSVSPLCSLLRMLFTQNWSKIHRYFKIKLKLDDFMLQKIYT